MTVNLRITKRRKPNDTYTGHSDIRQPEGRHGQDDALRHLRQLPRDEGSPHRRGGLRLPALHRQVPERRHQEVRGGTRPLRRGGMRHRRQGCGERRHGETSQRPEHRHRAHRHARKPESRRTRPPVRQLGRHRRAVPLRLSDRILDRRVPAVPGKAAQGSSGADGREAVHHPQPA